MHENEISEKIIEAAVEVHRVLGSGLLESTYEEALSHELHLGGLKFMRQLCVPIPYKGINLGSDLIVDLLVEEKNLLVNVRAQEKLSAIDEPQLLTFLRLTEKHLGLIINFQANELNDGIFRVVNKLEESPP